MKVKRIGWTNQNAQSAADASQVVRHGESIGHTQAFELASSNARFTAITCIPFDNNLKIGAGDGTHDPELGDARA